MSVPAAALQELLRQLHTGPAQEAATAKIALALWRRAATRGDAAAAEAAAAEAEARLDALFDGIAALERRGKELLTEAAR